MSNELSSETPIAVTDGKRGLSLTLGSLVAIVALLLSAAGQWWTQQANAETMAKALTDLRTSAETSHDELYKAIADTQVATLKAGEERIRAFKAELEAGSKYHDLQHAVLERQVQALELTASQLRETPMQMAAISARMQRLETALDTISKMQLQLNSLELHMQTLLGEYSKSQQRNLGKP